MSGQLEVLREEKINRARVALERARNLRRARRTMGVDGICQYIKDVDGDWLENWKTKEDILPNTEVHNNVSRF